MQSDTPPAPTDGAPAAPTAIFSRLEERTCPVCGESPAHATLFLESRIDVERLSAATFASRKVPEFMSYRLVKCSKCATIYAVAAPPAELLAGAYEEASYDTGEEALLAARAYRQALAPHLTARDFEGTAMEIGTGNGAFLTELLDLGFADVVGIEPSHAAADAAPPELRRRIRLGIFDENDFEPESLSLICCFQTLEHVRDPRDLVEAAFRLLVPGGILALVTHDYAAPINRLLGRRSPIIDLEHMQIFCRQSLDFLLTQAGYRGHCDCGLSQPLSSPLLDALLPLPASIKPAIGKALDATGIGGIHLSANVGNLMTCGRKPAR